MSRFQKEAEQSKRERFLDRKFEVFEGIFFLEKILDVWESFGRLKKNLRERKYQKRENFEDDGSLKLGVIITNSFIDQYKSRVHPRQRTSKFELSVFIYSFIYGFTRKLAQIVYTFSISHFFPYFMSGEGYLYVNSKNLVEMQKSAQTSS